MEVSRTASVSRPASRPNFNGLSLGLGLGLGCPCLGLGLGLGGAGFVYRVSRTGLGLEASLKTEAGSQDPVDKAGTSETETWAAETKTETEAIKIRSRGRPRDRGRSSRPPSQVDILKMSYNSYILMSCTIFLLFGCSKIIVR